MDTSETERFVPEMKEAAGHSRKPKLAILTNMLTPYRLAAYGKFGESFETLILHGGNERNRKWTIDVPGSLKEEKVWTLQIPMKKRTGVQGVVDTSYVHFNLGLVWRLPRFRPDVIIAHEMGLRTLYGIFYGKLARVPVWVWWGGSLHSERFITRSRAVIRRFLVRHVRRWISYGTTSTEYLESIGVSRENILQVQNCIRQETFQVATSGHVSWLEKFPRPVILTVAQLLPRKGLDKLIEACGRLVEKGREFTLIIVGEGPEYDRLSELAERNGIRRFQIVSNQSQPQLNEIYRAADVFVLPTLEDVWGLVVNEAMWAGLPVLCSKYAGCAPELLPDELIFDPLSVESFDAALERVFQNRLVPPDQSKLKTWQEVSAMISRSLLAGTPLE